MVRRKN